MLIPPALNDTEVVLASASPRRQMLLRELGIPFKVEVREIKEECPGNNLPPDEIALCLAKMKADRFPAEELKENTLVITADTVVSLKGQLIGKPMSRQDAIEMIGRLSGNMHTVYTGVCIKSKHKERSFVDETRVWFAHIPQQEIIRYVDACKPYDKAGSYGIQEWIGYACVERIEGSFFNVMGLPTHRLYQELTIF